MARKRMIDPEFWSDEEIALWSFSARLFYIALWNFADDEGRGKGHSKLLKAQIFPYDDRLDMEKLKKEVSQKVEWYKVNNQQYYYLHNFLKHQRIDRPTPSKLPLHESSTSPQRDVLPNIIEDKLSKDKVTIDNFNSLWETYPIKEGKKEALRHYQASIKAGDKHADIKQALENYINKLKVDGTKPPYIKHGKTFFNNWKDYLHYKVKPKIISRTDL